MFVKKGDNLVRVSDIITEPDGTSQKYILLGKETGSSGKYVAYHIDFSGLHMKKCKYKIFSLILCRELKADLY